MTATLFIFLEEGGGAVASAAIFDAALGDRKDIAVSDIAREKADAVVAVLAGEDVSTWSLELPALSDTKLMQILPSQLEDLRAITHVDDHYALLNHRNGNARLVACARKTVMDNALATVAQSHLNADVVVPDYALLPIEDEPVVAQPISSEDRLIVRMPDSTGFAGSRMIAAGVADITAPRKFVVTDDSIEQLAMYNLLQGDYTPRLPLAVYLPLFRRAAVLASLAGIVWISSIFLDAQNVQQQADDITVETERLFAEAFPEITRIVDMQAQARRLIAQSSSSQGGAFLRLSEHVFATVSRHDGAVIEGLRYNQDQNAFFVTVSVASFTESDALLSELRANQLAVTEGGSRQEDGRVITDIAIEVTL